MHRLIPVLAILTLGCGGSAPEKASPEPAAAASLPEAGQRYDPAIDPAEVPAGAWMCDMGTVHYAAPHAGECPVCGMKLVEKK
ncbi:MAG: hypothetical protein KC656_28210 [Myxococcales bacterium]|nr:hypothetical protein [Myxococcales bacterium]MCA9571767.1 hypothetical protein [Myxococcales bacterium]